MQKLQLPSCVMKDTIALSDSRSQDVLLPDARSSIQLMFGIPLYNYKKIGVTSSMTYNGNRQHLQVSYML